MKIGIDIDGVLTNMYAALIDNATKFCYQNNIKYNINQSEYNESKMFNISKDDTEKFWNWYLGEYSKHYPIREHAAEVIEEISQNNEIYIITARNEEGLSLDLYGTMQKMVKKWLKVNKIKYNKIIFTQEKLKACIENNIDIMIEDSPLNIKSIAPSIKVLCYDAPYNKETEGKNIIRVYSWYDILQQIEKIK